MEKLPKTDASSDTVCNNLFELTFQLGNVHLVAFGIRGQQSETTQKVQKAINFPHCCESWIPFHTSVAHIFQPSSTAVQIIRPISYYSSSN